MSNKPMSEYVGVSFAPVVHWVSIEGNKVATKARDLQHAEEMAAVREGGEVVWGVYLKCDDGTEEWIADCGNANDALFIANGLRAAHPALRRA